MIFYSKFHLKSAWVERKQLNLAQTDEFWRSHKICGVDKSWVIIYIQSDFYKIINIFI